MTKNKKTARVLAPYAELEALKNKAIDRYIGYNLCRIWFAEEADANRFLELQGSLYPESGTYLFYGGPVRAHVEKATYRNDPCFEVVYG